MFKFTDFTNEANSFGQNLASYNKFDSFKELKVQKT
jgi:hypothetical protein